MSSSDEQPLFADPSAGEALRIVRALVDAGFVAYLAGGCVRDALLGRAPKDFDVATNATPDSVREVFGRRRTLAFGASFGVIGVLPPHQNRRQSELLQPTEVATFRCDGTYSDGRHPDSVSFGDAEADARRRDFTVNGLFYDPIAGQVIDFVGGQADLKRGVLRTIGDSSLRFAEDKLRMLRAIRFATTLGFSIDAGTFAAIKQHADEINVVSGERIGAEMRRILTSPAAATGLQQIELSGLGRSILPEIAGADLEAVRLHLAHLPEHDFESAIACVLIAIQDGQSLRAIGSRWKLSNEEQRRIGAALKYWKKLTELNSLPWSAVQPHLIDRDVATILNVATSVAIARELDDRGIAAAREALAWPAKRLNPPPLVTGNDLQQAGIPVGPAYKTILQTIRDRQLDGQLASSAKAIELARRMVDHEDTR